MINKFLSSAFFEQNRKKVANELKNNSLAIVNSSDEFPRNGDQHFQFRQSSDLFYLTGINQEQTLLVLSPNNLKPEYSEILFLRKSDEKTETWEGHKLTKNEAFEISGIKTIFWTESFDSVISELFYNAENIYINTNENSGYKRFYDDSDLRLINDLRFKFPLHNYLRLSPIITKNRLIKTSEEIETIKHACKITRDAFLRVLKFVKPNVFEYEIEAEISYEFIRNQAKNHAYQPIVASGGSACVLHYIENNKQCNSNDLILLDFGAEFQNYASDLSRTIPVNGFFSERQKIVYQAVLNVLKKSTELMISGKTINILNKEVAQIMEGELIKIGLLNLEEVIKQNPENPLYKKYFMHGVSHFLGLDVHDVGTKDTVLEPGMILTCEPGIYIKTENIGIRLENDILITENGNINLMADIPIEIDEIENLMLK